MLPALSTFSISNAVPIAHCSFLLSLSPVSLSILSLSLSFFSYNLCCQGIAG